MEAAWLGSELNLDSSASELSYFDKPRAQSTGIHLKAAAKGKAPCQGQCVAGSRKGDSAVPAASTAA